MNASEHTKGSPIVWSHTGRRLLAVQSLEFSLAAQLVADHSPLDAVHGPARLLDFPGQAHTALGFRR